MSGWSERVMGQKGFFDVERRLEAISGKGDPLETIKKMVRWEDFRADIEAVTETKPEERKSNAGRKPYDTILKFKIVVLQSLHNLSDEQSEYLIRDRLSFMRFLDLELEEAVPDATTIWLFREALAEAGLIDQLFERFGQHLEAAGYIARGGQIIDATIVSVPKQRNTKEENEAIKAGKTPQGWEKQPAKNAQKDTDARWTKKNDESFYGYKNHVGVDKAHKLIRKWDATDAAVHDSQKLDDVLDFSNTGKEVWADSAYRSVQIEAGLKEKGLQSRIHRRAARNRPLSERQKSANTTRSKVRARVEHVFGHQQGSMGGKIVRTIGILRARFKIGMMNLGYNIRRLVQLERVAACKRTARSPARRQNGPRSGTHLRTSAATARSAEAELAESWYCSRCPQGIFGEPTQYRVHGRFRSTELPRRAMRLWAQACPLDQLRECAQRNDSRRLVQSAICRLSQRLCHAPHGRFRHPELE